MTNLHVGQKLWFVGSDRRSRNYWVTVEKVGRKWAKLVEGGRNAYRIDINTLWADGEGYSSPGRCYLSREKWEEETRVRALFSALTRRIGFNLREGVTESDICEAARLLKIDLEPAE